MTRLTVHDSPPADYLALAWKEFFAGRGRGVTLTAHFPWLDDDGVFFVVQREDDAVVGGLAVRPILSRDGQYRAGLIGLVCVRPDRRGLGIARALMAVAIARAADARFDDLLLWTGKPAVYEGLGFRVQDDATVALVQAGTAVPDGLARACTAATVMSEPGYRAAIPPFARTVRRFVNGDASLVVVDDATVVDWSGADASVARIVAATMPATWRLHALAHDTLPDTLATAGWRVEQSPSRLQMRLPLIDRAGPPDPYRLRLLDRV